MANDIQIFNNPQFGAIRTAISPFNEPMFCASDVCKALGYANSRDAVAKHVSDDDVAKHYIIDNLGRTQFATFVNESGLYSLIFGSKLETARTFKRWVTSQVLPAIRRDGGYIIAYPEESDAQILSRAVLIANATLKRRDEQIREMRELSELQATRITQQREIINKMHGAMVILKERASYLDRILTSKETVTTTQIAADYGMSAKKFNIILRNMRIQRKVNGQWILYHPYNTMGYVHSQTIEITHSDGTIGTKMNTQWRQAGRLFLYNELKKSGILPLIEQ